MQVWSGNQWQQTDFPDPGRSRAPLPLAVASPSPHGQGHRASVPAAGAASNQAALDDAKQAAQDDARQQAQPAAMSGFTAQALLECHYSHNNAFLQTPLLQVCSQELAL